MLELYNEKIMQIFKNPKNIGILHKADAVGVYTDENSSESIKIYLKIEDNVITASSFKAFAGAVTIACCQVATEKIIGLTLEEAMQFDATKIIKELGVIPTNKIRCSVTVVEGIKAAILDYYEMLEKEEKKRLRNERKEAGVEDDEVANQNDTTESKVEIEKELIVENKTEETAVDANVNTNDEEENIYAQNAKLSNKHDAGGQENMQKEQTGEEKPEENVDIFSKYPNMFKK